MVPQEKNSDKRKPLCAMTTGDNILHVQGCGNQVRCYHGVVENTNMSMNDEIPDNALRLAVRSARTLDDDIDECRLRCDECVSKKTTETDKHSHASHNLHIDFCDKNHGAGDAPFNFIGCSSRKRKMDFDGPIVDDATTSANMKQRSQQLEMCALCKFAKGDAHPELVDVFKRNCHCCGQANHPIGTREKTLEKTLFLPSSLGSVGPFAAEIVSSF